MRESRKKARNLTSVAIIALSSTALTSSNSFAQDISTAMGNGADAFVVSTSSNTNFGLEPQVAIKNDSGTGQLHRKGYFRFDLSSAQEVVTSATLELVYEFGSVNSPSSSQFFIYGLVDGHPGEGWDEQALTWNNAPGNSSGGLGLVAASVQLLGVLDLPISQTVPGDVITFSSPELLSFVQADSDGLLTIIVVRQQANLTNQTFASKEHGTYSPARLRLSSYETFCECNSGPCGGSGNQAGCLNSSGVGAVLGASGSGSVAADDLVLSVSGLPVNTFGIVFMGGGQTSPTLFGSGLLCVSPGPDAFCRFPIQNSGSAGILTEGPGVVGFSHSFSTQCHIQPGMTWNFQTWFRDIAGPCGSTFNLSNGVSVSFGP